MDSRTSILIDRFRRSDRRPLQHHDGTSPDHLIEITVDHGFRPTRVVAPAGEPLVLVFRKQDQDECSERVVFSSPHVERHLVPGADTSVRLPPQPPGEVRYTCGMGRYRGVIQLVEDRPRSAPARLRGWASGHEEARGLAASLWICSLPLSAPLSVLALDSSAIVPGALFALVAWTAGCLWAYRERSHSHEDERSSSTPHASGRP
ncbi:MAG: cupredoxin domain-containing protein [Chloroflexota bacterium]